jgi:hypothetical protein
MFLGRVDTPVQRPAFGKWSTSLREKLLKYGRIPANFSLVLRKICAKSDPFRQCQHALTYARLSAKILLVQQKILPHSIALSFSDKA